MGLPSSILPPSWFRVVEDPSDSTEETEMEEGEKGNKLRVFCFRLPGVLCSRCTYWMLSSQRRPAECQKKNEGVGFSAFGVRPKGKSSMYSEINGVRNFAEGEKMNPISRFFRSRLKIETSSSLSPSLSSLRSTTELGHNSSFSSSSSFVSGKIRPKSSSMIHSSPLLSVLKASFDPSGRTFKGL